MKFYVTIEPYWKLNNVFSNLNMFYLIDVDTLIRDSSLNPDKQSHRYLINTEIERLIVAAMLVFDPASAIFPISWLGGDAG